MLRSKVTFCRSVVFAFMVWFGSSLALLLPKGYTSLLASSRCQKGRHHHLLTSMSHPPESLSGFCKLAKERIQNSEDVHLFLGNEAGDADSILSAIGLSYLRSLVEKDNNDSRYVPLVSIPAESLKSMRPETTYLLENCAGMKVKGSVNDLVAIDQTELLPEKASLTLMDHNVFRLDQPKWTVTEIVDHHKDEGKHTDTCPPQNRKIAFEGSSALVASTTTLVAEEYYETMKEPMPPTLAILLLGTILLDSVNMSPKAGKGTLRDGAMIEKILKDTDWTKVSLPEEILSMEEDREIPDRAKLFQKLQDAKFSPEFWNGLQADQAIRMDYKSFPPAIGIASILLDMNHFCNLHGPKLFESMAEVLETEKVLGLMFSTFGKERKRQLALASYDKATLDRLVKFLSVDPTTTPDLQLTVTGEEERPSSNGNVLYFVKMEQGNVIASRKQVAPILMDFFQTELA